MLIIQPVLVFPGYLVTLIIVVQVETLPLPSVAFHVMVVVPTLSFFPAREVFVAE